MLGLGEQSCATVPWNKDPFCILTIILDEIEIYRSARAELWN
jgi:hypothetical protein